MPALANKKHEAVALAYLADPEKVGWRAYCKVYPKSSRHAAETAFGRLLKNADFAARVAETHEEAAKGAIMDANEVLEELSKVGRSSIQNYVVEGDDTADVVTALRDMRPEHAAAVHELTIETYVEGGGETARDVKRTKIKLIPKIPALDLLGKHHALYTEKHLHEFSGVADRLAAALARTDGRKRAAGGGQKGTHDGKVRPHRRASRAGGARKAARQGGSARAR